jgi:hypothetical protein
MDDTVINSSPFPAPFDEQRYALDEGMYSINDIQQGASLQDVPLISPREAYLKHYGF